MEPRIETPWNALDEVSKNADFERMTPTEREVAIYLNELGLEWVFEESVYLMDAEERARIYHPDFCLPKLRIYIEVWNSPDRSTEYREIVYKKNDIPVIFVHTYKEKKEWKNFLLKRIAVIESRRHNRVMDMLLGKSLE